MVGVLREFELEPDEVVVALVRRGSGGGLLPLGPVELVALRDGVDGFLRGGRAGAMV